MFFARLTLNHIHHDCLYLHVIMSILIAHIIMPKFDAPKCFICLIQVNFLLLFTHFSLMYCFFAMHADMHQAKKGRMFGMLAIMMTRTAMTRINQWMSGRSDMSYVHKVVVECGSSFSLPHNWRNRALAMESVAFHAIVTMI